MATIPDPIASVSIPREKLAKTQRLAAVGVSAAGAAHEINNLLTAPLSYCQLAKQNPDDPELREKAIQCANLALEAIRQISESMLDFVSRKRQLQAVDVKSSVARAISLLHKDPNKNRIKIVDGTIPGAEVHINAVDLQQILLNLLLNAMNAIQKNGGAGQIRISANKVGEFTTIAVSDTGSGISEEDVERLFTPFLERSSEMVRDQSEFNEEDGGNGLGLLVCKQLAEAAGGSIRLVRSNKDGTTFEVSLKSAVPIMSEAV